MQNKHLLHVYTLTSLNRTRVSLKTLSRQNIITPSNAPSDNICTQVIADV